MGIGKGFSATQIRQMRQFYLTYRIRRSLTDEFDPELSWTHYCELIKIEDDTSFIREISLAML